MGRESTGRPRGRPKADSVKQTHSFKFSDELWEEVTRAAHWERKTATEIMEEGLMLSLKRIRKRLGMAEDQPFDPVPER